MSDKEIKIDIGAFPKCKCGGEFVPTEISGETNIEIYWKCVRCEKKILPV